MPKVSLNPTNITKEHQEQFNALTSDEYSNYGQFALFSCFVNGEPTSAIVSITKHESEYLVEPLFVAITPNMVITDHEDNRAATL